MSNAVKSQGNEIIFKGNKVPAFYIPMTLIFSVFIMILETSQFPTLKIFRNAAASNVSLVPYLALQPLKDHHLEQKKIWKTWKTWKLLNV